MTSLKVPGSSWIPADLFKQAPTPLQGRIYTLVNEILVGMFDFNQDMLMAKVILIHTETKTTAS